MAAEATEVGGMRYLVTGAAGFIGSHLVREMLLSGRGSVRALDSLTYAGSMDNLADVADHPDFEFVYGDIRSPADLKAAVENVDVLLHLAAESHIDRCTEDPSLAVTTNTVGTVNVLEAAREEGVPRIVHVSTDEVYGEALADSLDEGSAFLPQTPYAATKAGADLICRAYAKTYGLPVMVHRGTNNYGPYQYPEKLIPRFVYLALRDEPLTIHGTGEQRRDWLHVSDNCRAILTVAERGEIGEAYNAPGGNERSVLDIAGIVLSELGRPMSLLRRVPDRPGNDMRYALRGDKLYGLGWRPRMDFETEVRATIRWFAERQDWLEQALGRLALVRHREAVG